MVVLQLPTRDGTTPLHEAAAAGHIEAAKVLISIGATADVTDQVSPTTPPLHHHTAVKALLVFLCKRCC